MRVPRSPHRQRRAGEPLSVLLLNWRDLDHPEGGGSELYAQSIARELAAAGNRVTMFCAAYDGARREEMCEGYRIVRGGGRHTVYARAALAWWSRRVERADVVVDVQNGVPFFASLWARRPVVVLVHHVHRELWPVVLSPVAARVGWWIESRLAPWANRGRPYVTVSQATRDELVELGVRPDRITVVRNGTPACAAEGPRGTVPEICVLGRLVPHKRIEHAVRAFATLRERHPDLRLTIIGQGYWEPQLRALVTELALSDAVEFTGYVDESTKHRLLARAWVLAMPSVKEGWGLSIVEAASHGTPAVAYRAAGGVAESIVADVTGLLVHDEDGFTHALDRALSDAVLRDRLGATARVHAERFAWPVTAAAFSDVLHRAVAGRAPHLRGLPSAVADEPAAGVRSGDRDGTPAYVRRVAGG